MSASFPNPAEIPIEILEQILLCLPGQDIIKMEAVNRYLRDLVRNSPNLQHRRELFAIGLIDNPCCPCDLAERRKLREAYAHKWTTGPDIVMRTKELPPGQSFGWGHAEHLGNGYLAPYSVERNDLTFLYVPPVASQKPVEGWTIPSFAYEIHGYTVYPPGNVIAVAEQVENSARIHLLSLRDGSPYHPLPFDTIAPEILPGVCYLVGDEMAITGSRVMIFYRYQDEDLPDDETVLKVSVWDWKTGDLVLDLSSTDETKLVTRHTQVVFLDEFRLILLPDGLAVTELIVLNTLIPQDCPGNLRRLGVPQRFHHQFTKIFLDRDRPLGAPNKNEPLIADPAQAVLVLKIMSNQNPYIFLLVRMQTLVEQTRSTSTDSCVPWEEWGSDAVVMEVPTHDDDPEIFVHGAQVAMVWSWSIHDWRIQTFDFSWRGCSSLPLWADGGSGTERSVLFEGEEGFMIQPGVNMVFGDEMGLLRDGSLLYLKAPDEGTSSGATLHIWELV